MYKIFGYLHVPASIHVSPHHNHYPLQHTSTYTRTYTQPKTIFPCIYVYATCLTLCIAASYPLPSAIHPHTHMHTYTYQHKFIHVHMHAPAQTKFIKVHLYAPAPNSVYRRVKSSTPANTLPLTRRHAYTPKNTLRTCTHVCHLPNPEYRRITPSTLCHTLPTTPRPSLAAAVYCGESRVAAASVSSCGMQCVR